LFEQLGSVNSAQQTQASQQQQAQQQGQTEQNGGDMQMDEDSSAAPVDGA
jgi:hypothetical protein